jgi:putative ABC transport system permease protein
MSPLRLLFMLRNYLKTALRNLSRNRFFAILNIFGLALGMSISLVIIAVLMFLHHYDDFHPLKDRLYRVITDVRDNQNNPSFASAPPGFATVLRHDVPGVEKVIRINGNLAQEFGYDEKKIPVYGLFADPEFLTLFNFPLLKGNPLEALTQPQSIVITAETARKIFGDKDPMGELVNVPPYGEMMVTGVLKKIPANSHMQFEAVASYETLLSYKGPSFADREDGWTDFYNSYIYMLLSDNADPSTIETALNDAAKAKYKKTDFTASFKVQNLDDIILGPQLYNNIGPSWDALAVTLGSLVTLLILVPACANYVNLAISQSLKRMREIGVRKVMGGQKRQIFLQFVVETVITMMFALMLSYLFFEIIRGEALTVLADASIMDLTPTFEIFVAFFVFALLVGLIAGIVPALFFSKVTPVYALKGKIVNTGGGFPIRKIMITIQFILSLGFTMTVMIMLNQYRYAVNYDFGFSQENVLDINLQNVDPALLKNEVEKVPSVESVAMSSLIIGLDSRSAYVKNVAGQDSLETHSISVDENFISTMKLELVYGREFSENATENERIIVINEQFAKAIDADAPFNSINQGVTLRNNKEVRVAGIVKDFHYGSLRDPIGNFFFEYDPTTFRHANVRFQGGDPEKNITSVAATWKTYGGESKFDARMLPDEIKDAYHFYLEVIKLWSFLGFLAITVACMGLLGTVVFTIKGRVKEISLRKVMGASAESLVVLLSKDFAFLMLIASVITIPSVYFLFDLMLSRTQYYRLDIGVTEILISVLILLVLAMTTILSQTVRAANANPVDNLKVE